MCARLPLDSCGELKTKPPVSVFPSREFSNRQKAKTKTVAIYHFSAQVIGRSSGRSSTAAAAYRSGEKVIDERTGEIHDYTRKTGVVHTEIVVPDNAPDWAQNRSELWNQVEAIEKRKDAQLCREINVALPHELSREQQVELMRDYCKAHFADKGMVVDFAIHKPHGIGVDARNMHAHIMVTTREIGPEGFGKKNRDWNSTDTLEAWREGWADHANRTLERAGHDVRIDHRSLEAQGIDRAATIHQGPAVTQLERQGIKTEIGDYNRAAQELAKIKATEQSIDKQLKAIEKGAADLPAPEKTYTKPANEIQRALAKEVIPALEQDAYRLRDECQRLGLKKDPNYPHGEWKKPPALSRGKAIEQAREQIGQRAFSLARNGLTVANNAMHAVNEKVTTYNNKWDALGWKRHLPWNHFALKKEAKTIMAEQAKARDAISKAKAEIEGVNKWLSLPEQQAKVEKAAEQALTKDKALQQARNEIEGLHEQAAQRLGRAYEFERELRGLDKQPVEFKMEKQAAGKLPERMMPLPANTNEFARQVELTRQLKRQEKTLSRGLGLSR